MKKLAIGVLSFALLLPAPAEALFGSECRSLKKRTQANQVKYEAVWDKYQTTKAQFLLSKPEGISVYSNNPVVPRWIELNKQYMKIVQDFSANKKCLKTEFQNENWNKYIKDAKNNIEKPNGYSATYTDAFNSVYDFRTAIK